MLNRGLMTSDKEDWETPQRFFDSLNDKYHFTWDLAASESNHKCKNYLTKDDDALNQDWSKLQGNLFLNPPYGRHIKDWVKKSYESSLNMGGTDCSLNTCQNRYKLLA